MSIDTNRAKLARAAESCQFALPSVDHAEYRAGSAPVAPLTTSIEAFKDGDTHTSRPAGEIEEKKTDLYRASRRALLRPEDQRRRDPSPRHPLHQPRRGETPAMR